MPIILQIYLGGEKGMGKVFWIYFHSIMFVILLIISVFTEIAREGKDISKNLKKSEKNSDTSIGETIVLILILCGVAFSILGLILNVVLKNPISTSWFVGIYVVVYAYIAIKQIIKMIFIPEKREFSITDIKDFVYTYMFWWIMISAMRTPQAEINLLNKIPLNYQEVIKVALLILCYYFNILFALGGMYILLYYLRKAGNMLENRLGFIKETLKELLKKLCDWCQKGEKFLGLRSFKIWKENRKKILYKIFMTIPLFLLDIWKVIWLFVRMFIQMTLLMVIVSILDPIRVLCKLIKGLWNRHKNNEWMYIFAQIAGLCSYVIVFIMIQYGEYGDAFKNVYEFAGTIILIPYFLGKIVKLQKKTNEHTNEVSENEKKTKSHRKSDS